ncbi:hypothetical protein J2X45_002358 [Caulobacter sp. BE264]|uniref:DUF1109 domain-containing protein n=1 Tax=Caulobacter sp. BE264 TaxID=2817724 RepID=UPI00285B1238|nr:DUF1109 domain-containing protein [Caulobacter sp. BE264]MDR7231263.1 hypothetical protein [Caulobacter sp. BE264]
MTIDDILAPASGGTPIWSAETLPWRLAEVAAAGALGGLLMILAWLGLRPDLAQAVQTPLFWIKVGYAAALALGAGLTACRLARGRARGLLPLMLAACLAGGFLIFGLFQALAMAPQALLQLYWPTALTCIVAILALATPMLLFASYGLASVDPERPRLVGFAGGVACGAVADLVFGLHCPFTTFAFIAPWHTAGALICGGAGLLLVELFGRLRRMRRPLNEEIVIE